MEPRRCGASQEPRGLYALKVTPPFCVPPTATIGQMVRVVVKYIDQRPERLHEQFTVLAYEALKAAWPCKQ
jgi:Rap1a immunity proteins